MCRLQTGQCRNTLFHIIQIGNADMHGNKHVTSIQDMDGNSVNYSVQNVLALFSFKF